MRRAVIADFLAIAALDRVAWRENSRSAYIPDGEHIWRLWVAYSTVFVVVVRTQIVGTTILFRANDKNLYILHKMFVVETERDKKLGHLLFSEVGSFLDRGPWGGFLTTDPDNKRMQHLCKKFGFLDKTFVPGYYRPDEDRVCLQRKPQALEAPTGSVRSVNTFV